MAGLKVARHHMANKRVTEEYQYDDHEREARSPAQTLEGKHDQDGGYDQRIRRDFEDPVDHVRIAYGEVSASREPDNGAKRVIPR